MFLDVCVCQRQHSHGQAHTSYQPIRPDCQRSVFRFGLNKLIKICYILSLPHAIAMGLLGDILVYDPDKL